MAQQQARTDIGRASVDRTRSGQNGGSIGLVLLIAVVLVGVGVGLMLIGRTNAEPYILFLLAVLAMFGVFMLFAIAAGMLIFPSKDAASPLIKSLVDSGVNAILVTDAAGRVVYANTAYLKLVEANGAGDVRPPERVFVGDPGVSEAVFRLLKAAREGRRLQEEVRVDSVRGETARWLRMRVRPLGESARDAKLTVWSIADVTRELERQENVFQELQHAVDYLDHAPAGFFSVDAAGNISYLNATLAEWLEQDLAEVGSGGLRLNDIVAGEGGALVTTLSAAPGEVKTELFDIDLKTKSGRTVPARLYHKVAFGADGTPGSSRTLVINRAGDDGNDPLRAAEVRFMRFFQNTPMAIATVDKQGTIVRSNALFARLFNPVLKEGGGRSILAVVAERDRAGARNRDRPRGGQAGRDRSGRRDARGPGRALRALLCHRGRRGRRPRDRHRLCARDHRAARPAEPAQPAAEDGAGRPARRRHRPRLQQRARRHHDGVGLPGERAQADRSVVPGHHPDPAERQPRRRAGAPSAGVLAQADAAAAGHRPRRGGSRSAHAAQAADRRAHHAQHRAAARPVAGEGRPRAVRAGDRQSRGQRPRRDGRRRQAHAAHRQCRRRPERDVPI